MDNISQNCSFSNIEKLNLNLSLNGGNSYINQSQMEEDGKFSFESKSYEQLIYRVQVLERENKIYKNDLMDLIDDLDSLPYPDRKTVYDSFPSAEDIRIKNFMTMRGCPHNCTYCFNHKYHEMYSGKGKMLRRRSVGNVIEEILDVSSNI